MGEPAVEAADHGGTRTGEPSPGDGLSELRRIIVGPEQRQLRALQFRLNDPAAQVRDVSRVLPDAMALRANDPRFVEAVAPSVEEALTASVRRNPQPLADALFPIMGPAIRKAIAHALNSMVESFNRTLEYSLSWRSLQWRLTALRTGRSFAEVVLLKTLVYRVEQVFLIQPESGLLMQHVTTDLGAAQGADQISAMLTAIRDFVQDSFGGTPGQALDALRVGDLSVYVEQGPYAVLAAVVRGTAPQELRATFQEVLETIHRRYSDDLQAFEGDAASLAGVRPLLQALLQTQYQPPRRTRSYGRWAVAGVLLLVLAAWAFFAIRERQRWNGYVERLRAEPGVVVVAAGREGGRYRVLGLRDPLAADPDVLLSRSGLAAERVERRWEPYQASNPEFVLPRARQVLRPPPSVSLTLQDGVLAATGTAPSRWIAKFAQLAPLVPGVRRVDRSAVVASDVLRLQDEIAAVSPRFAKGSAEIPPGGDGMPNVILLLRELNQIGLSADTRFRVDITGHADADGEPNANLPLSQSRAEAVRSALPASEWSALDLHTSGAGSAAPLVRGATEAEKRLNRRVSFRVSVAEADQPGSVPR